MTMTIIMRSRNPGMTMTGTTKYVIGLASIAAISIAYGSVSSKSTAQCGGLFLLDTETAEVNGTRCYVADTVSVGKYTAFGSFGHYRLGGTWNDGWELSIKSSDLVGSAGIQASFKYIDFFVTANSLSSMTSGITVHAGDSSTYIGSFIGKGHPVLGTVRWDSESESSEINHIEADWETDFVRKGFVIGANFGNHHIHAELEDIRTAPYSANEEYFIKDSSHLDLLGIRYAFEGASNKFHLRYLGASANLEIIGNTFRDNSTKRFIYVPRDASLHFGEASWYHKDFGLHTASLFFDARMERNNDRFFETFAPNRLLAPSLTQALSFSFAQQNYRVDTDLNIFAFTAGASYSPHLNFIGHSKIVPSIGILGYYTYDELDVQKSSETTRLIYFESKDESWHWQLESIGTIFQVGLSWEKTFTGSTHKISLDWDASQLVPLDFDFSKEYSDGGSKRNTDETIKTRSGTGIFQNGFASSLTIRYSF